MKRMPLASLLGVLCFSILSTFTLHRAAADRQQQSSQSNQQTGPALDQMAQRPNKTVVNADGTITTVSDNAAEGEFVPGEMLVKFRNENDAVDAGRGMKDARGHLKMGNPRLNEIFARFGINNGRRPFVRARLKSLAPGWPQATKAVGVRAPAIGDIDGDGLPEVVAGNDRVIENGSSANYLFAWHADGTMLPNWPVKYDRQITVSSFGYGAPALADLDQDGRADIIISSDTTFGSTSALNAYKFDGSKVPGFPKPTLDNGAFVTNTVAVADLEGDGLMEVAWIDRNAMLYVWDVSAPSTAVAPWAMFQHDERHTGASLRTPETLPPTATITSPSAGAHVAGTVNVTTQASDNVGVVNLELYRDNILVGSSTQNPFTFEWDTAADAEGPHTFVSKAYDAAGNIGTSPPVVFNVDKTPPTTGITAPTNGAILSGSAVVISANASDSSGISRVEFYMDNNVLLTTDTSLPYTFSWNSTTVTQGAHSLYAIAQDTSGLRTTSATIAITVDNTAPTVAITSPANGATVARNSIVNINANAADNVGVVKVEFYVGTTLRCTVTSAPYTCVWQVPNQKANFSLRATAYDVVGKTTTHTISVSSR